MNSENSTIQEKEVTEVQEIRIGNGEKTAENLSEGTSDKSKKRISAGGIVYGVLMLAAVVVLAVCLYRTSEELRTVQTLSKGMQTKLKITETKLNDLSVALNGNVPKSEEETEEVPSGETGSETVTKWPYPTPVPEVLTVCIDAGHGAHDTGAVLEYEDGTFRQEKDDNLWLAQLLKTELEAYGVKVIMTREDDSFLELYDRTLMANSHDVDLLVSLHRNAYYLNGKMHEGVKGVEIWIHNSQPTGARRLANRMLDAILEVGGMQDRGVRYGSVTDPNENYAINRRAMMTSMIVEMGFVSNTEDNEAYDANGKAYAKAMAKEIYAWLTE